VHSLSLGLLFRGDLSVQHILVLSGGVV
jgi:hypothetical protein